VAQGIIDRDDSCVIGHHADDDSLVIGRCAPIA